MYLLQYFMIPFHHVHYQGMEYALRNPQTDGTWIAFDINKRLHVVHAHACTHIEPIVRGHRVIQDPLYFRQTKEGQEMFPMVSAIMKKEIDSGKTCGYFEDDNAHAWAWDTKKMSFQNDFRAEVMRVVTTGGWLL